MKVFTAEKIREADQYTIKNEPISSVDLMERAANKLCGWITENFVKNDPIKIFCGPGNNGGDGWALARLLHLADFSNIEVFLLKISDNLSPDSQINYARLKEISTIQITEISNTHEFPMINKGDVVVDALFGSGLSRPLSGLPADCVKYLNASDKKALIAIDIPSGLFSEDNSMNSKDNIIQADVTLSFQFPKLVFFFPENAHYIGKWHSLSIGLHPDFISKTETPYYYLDQEFVRSLLRKRDTFSHKGTYGHGLLIAGSYGMMGAAVLAARSALRAGPGLLTAHVPRLGVDIMQTAVPESLLSIDESDFYFTEHQSLEKFTAIGIGPGLNQKSNTKKGLLALLKQAQIPMVLDADALNILSGMEGGLELIPPGSVLTPHPKEFERLFGKYNDDYSRLQAQQKFSADLKSVIVLKGAYTCITTPGGKVYFNSTGNPGMATGGSGDVLTGIILGLLAQQYNSDEAAVLGVFLHGLAGDLAAEELGQYSLIPSDIINNIGKAFCVLEKTH